MTLTTAVENNEPVGLLPDAGRRFAALVGIFALQLTAFVVCVTLLSAGVGLAILVVGLVLLVAGLAVAGWAARMQRLLLASTGVELPPTYRSASSGSGLRGLLGRLARPQAWRDLLHVLIAFPVSVVTFSLAVTWVVGGLGGVTYWLWSTWLPDDNTGLPALLGYPGHFADVLFNSAVGVVLLLTAPAVLRGLVGLHAALATALLVDETPELRERVSALTESRTAAGQAEAHTLRRLERDLHDGPQQRLVRLGMDIAAAERRLDTDPGAARALLGEALQQSQDALAEIRNLSRGIAPPILDEQGLSAAVTALVARGSVPTVVDVEPVRLAVPVRHAAYFVVAEALTNVEKHSAATRAAVDVRRLDDGSGVAVTVSDDGVGGASTARGHGLAGLADRLAGVDGTLVISSPAGGGTQVTAVLPEQREG
ncbi:sensor histidine kinase [Microlunatus flavus]|uniref:histidine kinase n=1 Tax=Microlunatus flavus TaxID=1036181 RepID=A0A1H9HJW4_9ACTN|nr:sensor histidine kinase [Microlunatus flavus]SEQ62593.1 Histidine kinase [Microlunatus flavus]